MTDADSGLREEARLFCPACGQGMNTVAMDTEISGPGHFYGKCRDCETKWRVEVQMYEY